MRALALGTLLLLASCASAPLPSASTGPTGPLVEVALLGDGFVGVGGRRTTVEELVYDLRQQCRLAGPDASARPWVRVVAPRVKDPALTRQADRVRSGALDAGVRHVELALEGS